MAPRTRASAGASVSAATSSQQSIRGFGRPIKSGLPTATGPRNEESGKKRKTNQIWDDFEQPSKKVKVEVKAEAAATLPTPDQTPVKANKHIRDTTVSPAVRRLQLSKLISSIPYTSQHQTTALCSPPATPSRREAHDSTSIEDGLPTPLEELIQLYQAFLRALTLHYAHNSGFSPVDTRVLIPSITRCWRKRKPTLRDLRQIMAISDATGSPFSRTKKSGKLLNLELVDYGQSKICIDRIVTSEEDNTQGPRLPIKELQKTFKTNLAQLWTEWSDKADVNLFIASLPLHPIRPSPSLKKMAPVLAKGQQRLTNFRTKLASAMKEPSTPDDENMGSLRPVKSRGQSLLERIKLKELSNNATATASTTARAERRMALNRLDEIIATLDMLSTPTKSTSISQKSASKPSQPNELLLPSTRAKTSFSLAQLSQTIRQSLASPISREEVAACLDLLAKEVAPEWVEIYRLGKMVGVVLRPEGRRGCDGWKGRVEGGAD